MEIDGIELGAKINDCFEFSKFPSGEIKVEFYREFFNDKVEEDRRMRPYAGRFWRITSNLQ